jgi:hypothetical protein
LRSPALIAAPSKAGCHAVLASLSGRYPPLRGRSPTRYSPVRHSTQGRSPFRVRLACVRHAASVDSEPGSNSHVKFVARLRSCWDLGRINSLTRAPVDLALALFSSFVRRDNRLIPLRGFTGAAVHRHPHHRIIPCPGATAANMLTLDGRPPTPSRLTPLERWQDRFELTRDASTRRSALEPSLCLHALSSFQRTRTLTQPMRHPLLCAAPPAEPLPPSTGEPYDITTPIPFCQGPPTCRTALVSSHTHSRAQERRQVFPGTEQAGPAFQFNHCVSGRMAVLRRTFQAYDL